MKKIIMVLVLSVVVPSVALGSQTQTRSAQEGASDSIVSTEVAPTESPASQSSNQNEVQVQNRTNNPSTGEMVEQQTQTREQVQDGELLLGDVPANSAQRRSQIAGATESLISTSYQIENRRLGDQIRTLAQEQEKNYEDIESTMQKIASRTSFAKFFIGPNYSQIKSAQGLLNQYKSKISQMYQIQTQLEDKSQYQNIASNIELLNEQIISLEQEIEDSQTGFSLFGWLGRLLNN